jgi:hypothetical protein
VSKITGKQELYFPPEIRFKRQIVSALVVGLWIILVCFSIAIQVSIGAYAAPTLKNEIAVNFITSLLGIPLTDE